MITERTERQSHPHYSRSQMRRNMLASIPKQLRREPEFSTPGIEDLFRKDEFELSEPLDLVR